MYQVILNYEAFVKTVGERTRLFSGINDGIEYIKSAYGADIVVQESFDHLRNRQTIVIKSGVEQTLESVVDDFISRGGIPTDVGAGKRFVEPALRKKGKKVGNYSLAGILFYDGSRPVIDLT